MRESKHYYWLTGKTNQGILIAVQKKMFGSADEQAAFKAFVARNIAA